MSVIIGGAFNIVLLKIDFWFMIVIYVKLFSINKLMKLIPSKYHLEIYLHN